MSRDRNAFWSSPSSLSCSSERPARYLRRNEYETLGDRPARKPRTAGRSPAQRGKHRRCGMSVQIIPLSVRGVDAWAASSARSPRALLATFWPLQLRPVAEGYAHGGREPMINASDRHPPIRQPGGRCMKKGRFLPIAALMFTGAPAFGQSSACEAPSVSACRGDRACISEAQQRRVECRATQDRGNRPVVPVPEPATLLLLGAGLIAIALSRHRRQS
jgi:hypothetical protein